MTEKRLIVFVCTGNICRSPMAEYLFREQIRTAPELRVCSAGVMAGFGVPASRFALQVLEELGIDASAHRSQPVTPDLVNQAERIVVMTEQHREILTVLHPNAAGRIVLLKSFDPESDGGDVMDPIGLSLDVYRYVRDEIAGALQGLEASLQTSGQQGGGGSE